jgi:hypothetical protein
VLRRCRRQGGWRCRCECGSGRRAAKCFQQHRRMAPAPTLSSNNQHRSRRIRDGNGP